MPAKVWSEKTEWLTIGEKIIEFVYNMLLCFALREIKKVKTNDFLGIYLAKLKLGKQI